MTRRQRDDLVRFAGAAARAGLSPHDVLDVMDAAKKVQRLHEKQSNEPNWGDRDEAKREKVLAKVADILRPAGILPEWQRDPRGWPLKLVMANGDEVGVPIL